jgi:hypothetical protein
MDLPDTGPDTESGNGNGGNGGGRPN